MMEEQHCFIYNKRELLKCLTHPKQKEEYIRIGKDSDDLCNQLLQAKISSTASAMPLARALLFDNYKRRG
jgi:hypothetical protein